MGSQAPFGKWSLLMLAVFAEAACSTRHGAEPNDEQPPSKQPTCDDLRAARPSVQDCSGTLGDWVWALETDAKREPSIWNPKDVRLDGEVGAVVVVNGEQWWSFGDVALALNSVVPEEVTGRYWNCAQEKEHSHAFVARPLGARAPTEIHFSVSAQLGADDFGFTTPHRGSDLTSLAPNTLVLALGPAGLLVVDVSDVTRGALRVVARISAPVGDDFNDVVAADERYVFVASKRRGLVLWDLLTPNNPAFVADGFPAWAPRDGHSVLRRGNTLYLAQAPAVGTGALTAFDVTNPNAPVERWRFVPEDGHDVHDVNVWDERVYVSSLRGGLYVLRVNDHAEPKVEVIARKVIEGAHSVASLLDADGVDLFVLTTERLNGETFLGRFEPSSGELTLTSTPTAQVGTSEQVHAAASPHNVECRQGLCFVAHYQLGLRVFDWSALGSENPNVLRNERAPALASFSTWLPSPQAERAWLSGASGVLLTSQLVYVLDTHNGLFALGYEP